MLDGRERELFRILSDHLDGDWLLVDHSSGVWNAFFRILSCVAMSGMETGDWRGEEQSPAWSQLSVALHHIIPSPSHLSLSPRSIISVL